MSFTLSLISLILVAAGVSGGTVFQEGRSRPTLEFEVATVKPNANGSDRAYLQALPGRLLMQNFTVRGMILLAYGIGDYQITGGPDWIISDHYDVQATADGRATVQQMEGPMLQALIRDRFHLVFHREMRQLPVHELKLQPGTRKLASSKEDCTPYLVDSQPPAASAVSSATVFCGFPRLSSNGRDRRLDGTRLSMNQLADRLSRSLRRPVIDKTGLKDETFDIHLIWTEDIADAVPNPDLPSSPSLFTAIAEQLGLKLESTKGPVEVLVIDYAEKPSQN
jgi:uncharacterized protein (TIGR03435 family)